MRTAPTKTNPVKLAAVLVLLWLMCITLPFVIRATDHRPTNAATILENRYGVTIRSQSDDSRMTLLTFICGLGIGSVATLAIQSLRRH